MDSEKLNAQHGSEMPPAVFHEIPSTTPSFSDMLVGFYAIAAVATGVLALTGRQSPFWLWLLPLSIIALPGAIRQSLRGRDGSTDAPMSFSRLRMWILGCFGGLILGKGLSAHHWPTLLIGTAYIILAFWGRRSKERQPEIEAMR